MITLTTDKGIVRIESWDDILSRPGFLQSVDPKAIKLKNIIASYDFEAMVPCGLANCHQPHGKGFLVVTECGHETNLGNVCGKKNFSVTFTRMKHAHLNELRAQENREALHAAQSRLDGMREEVAALRGGDHGATWIHGRVSLLLGKRVGLPSSVTALVRDLSRRPDGAIFSDKAVSQADQADRQAAQEVAGLDRRAPLQRFERVRVGNLDGHIALQPNLCLREIVVLTIEPFLESISNVDIDKLSQHALRKLAKSAGEWNSTIQRLRDAVTAGTRLLTKANITQLKGSLSDRKDRAALQEFIDALP